MIDYQPLPLLLEPAELEPILDREDLLIVDLSNVDNYARHHIPGSVYFPPQVLQSGMQPAVGKLPGIEGLSLIFSRLGLTTDKHVVVYDDEGGGWAGRMIWTLDVLGHQRYSYLNGGLHAWLNEGHPVEAEANIPLASNYVANIDTGPIAEADDILATLDDPDVLIWDARSAAEYRGERLAAARGGHIPGAINLDWLELMDRSRNLRLLPREQLQQRLQDAGITADKRVITHCHTHHRSGLSYLAMKVLGYPDIQGYHGSWAEWGNNPDLPIEV